MSSVNEAVRLFWNYLNSLEDAERNEARCILADFLEENNYSELSGVLKNETSCSVYYVWAYTDDIGIDVFPLNVVTQKVFNSLCDDFIHCIEFPSKLEAAQWQNGLKEGYERMGSTDDCIFAVSVKRDEVADILLAYLANYYTFDIVLLRQSNVNFK